MGGKPQRFGRDFTRLAVGNGVSNLSDGIAFISMPLLAASISDDPRAVAGLAVAYSLPRAVAVLGLGILIDRVDRRRLLYASNFSRAVVFALLAVLVGLDRLDLWLLYCCYAVIGIIETLADSTVFAVLPKAVASPARLDRANSRIAGTQIVVDEFIGPPLGGLLFGMAAFAPTAVSAVLVAAAGLCCLGLRGDYRPAPKSVTERASVLGDLRAAAAWTARRPIVRTLVVIGAITSVGYMIPFSYLVLYADKVLGLDATGYGLLLSFSALGGLLGSWAAPRIRRQLGYGWSIVGALGLGAASFAVMGLSENLIVVAIALAAYICHAVIWGILANSLRQRLTPDSMLGRVGSLSRLSGLLGLALGAWLGGTLADVLGLTTPFLVAAACFAISALFGVLVIRPIRSWEHGDSQ